MGDIDFFDNWTVQIRKGLLELCILNALLQREQYGYDLVKQLVAIPGLGITEGTLYPLLSRLKKQGLVTTKLIESSEGPARKYYALTTKGKKAATVMSRHLDILVQGAKDLEQKEGRND